MIAFEIFRTDGNTSDRKKTNVVPLDKKDP